MRPRGDKHTLIIGYGNPNRRDDGVGWYVVARLKSKLKQAEGVKALTFHQLEVGMVDEIKNWDRVIFVDATRESLKDGWRLRRINPEKEPCFSHHLDPSSLLGLAKALYGVEPEATMISIVGHDFDFGSGFTPQTLRVANRVVEEILRLVSSRCNRRFFIMRN